MGYLICRCFYEQNVSSDFSTVIYLTATMTLGTISICLTVLVLNVHHRGARYPVPYWLKKFILSYLSRVVCVRARAARATANNRGKAFAKKMEKMKKIPEGNGVVDDMELLSLTVGTRPSNGPRVVPVKDNAITTCDNHNVCSCGAGSGEEEMEDFSKDWHELAHVLDRVFFWLLFTGMTTSAVFILLYPRYMGIIT